MVTTLDRLALPSQSPQVIGTSRLAQVWANFLANGERLCPLKHVD
jgi:hypothetical protein